MSWVIQKSLMAQILNLIDHVPIAKRGLFHYFYGYYAVSLGYRNSSVYGRELCQYQRPELNASGPKEFLDALFDLAGIRPR
jgi:hypothetical protein